MRRTHKYKDKTLIDRVEQLFDWGVNKNELNIHHFKWKRAVELGRLFKEEQREECVKFIQKYHGKSKELIKITKL